MAEHFRISYQVPEGHGKKILRSVTLNRPDQRLRIMGLSNADAEVIANGILQIAPGTNFNQHRELHREIVVERVTTNASGEERGVYSVTGWNRKVRRHYKHELDRLQKDLEDVKTTSVKEGKKAESTDYQMRPHKKHVIGALRAKFFAIPVAGRTKTAVENLQPGQSIPRLAGELQRLIRRSQDVDAGDPENLTHGIGAHLTDRIKDLQGGILSGIAVNLAEETIPYLTPAIEAITTAEKFSSTDPLRTKMGYVAYEALFDVVSGRGNRKSPSTKDSLGTQLKKRIKSRLLPHINLNPRNYVLPYPVVVEQQTDRQTGRQDRSELFYVGHIINGDVNNSSLAFRRYQMDMAIAYQGVFEHAPGKVTRALRRGETGLAGKVAEEIEERFPGVIETLNRIMEHHEEHSLPAGYTDNLRRLKQLADGASPLEYFTYLQEMSQDEAIINQLAPEKQVAWKLSGEFATYLLDIYTKAKVLTDESRNLQMRKQSA